MPVAPGTIGVARLGDAGGGNRRAAIGLAWPLSGMSADAHGSR